MTEKREIPDYITFGRTFENYRWYKPILVMIIFVILYIIIQIAVIMIFSQAYGADVIFPLLDEYEDMNSELGSHIGYLVVAVMIPALYIAAKIVRDRPFSSYSSSRGGWNWKLFFKCLIIPIAFYLIFGAATAIIYGQIHPSTLTVQFFLISLIIIPLQCIAEEYVFRGLLMQSLGSWFKIPVLALILQAVIFAVLHSYNLIGVLGVLFDGLVFGFFAWKTNGLEAGSALHSVNNFSVSMLVALGLQDYTSTVTAMDFATTIAFTLVLSAVMYYVGYKKGWFEEQTSESAIQ